MSSVPNKNMNSITTRLTAGRLGKALARLFFRGLFWLFLVPAAYLAVREHTAFGRLSVKTEREFTIVRDTAGEPEDLLYTARDGEAAEPLRIRLWSSLRIWLIVWGVLLGLQFIGILIAYQSEKRRVREILTPLYELAAQAEALSQMEFGEDKYRLIEDAVSHLGADDGARLKLGDSDLAGVEAAINNLLTRIRESNRQQARFVNDASHELRTPIAVISGYADILARWGKDDEKVLNESIAAIRTETQRMKHLVEQLLFLARGDAGRTQLQKEDVSLADARGV